MSLSRLSLNFNSTGGRNNRGKITSYHRGGGTKNQYKFFDVNFYLKNLEGQVLRILYRGKKRSGVCLVGYSTGHYGYIIYSGDIKVGDMIGPRDTSTLMEFNSGDEVCNMELFPGSGMKVSRAIGSSSVILKKYEDLGLVLVKLKSGELRLFPGGCLAVKGTVKYLKLKNFRKAGERRWLGRRPVVRGVAMNPVDHPHGGGEGKTSGGRPSVTPWGKLTKGVKTRKSKLNKWIVKRKYSRSAWKGVVIAKETNNYVWKRSSAIVFNNVGKMYHVHNGREFKEIFVEESMVGEKWGSFCFTRVSGLSKNKAKKKNKLKKKK